MSNNFIHMSKLRQILKMYNQSLSKQYISDTTGVARNTVKSHLRTFNALNKSIEELLALDDTGLEAVFKGVPGIRNEESLLDLYAFFANGVKKLARRGTVLLDLWEEYAKTNPEGLKRTTFYRHYNLYKRRIHPCSVIEHKAGDKMFIDFTGEKYPYVDILSGEIKQAELFVAILGCSQLTFAQAIESQQVADFIECCIHALEYFGGAPLAIVPDNLKSAVIKSHRYEPRLNENFEGFARHYGMSVVPARAYKPKDKALVEGAVKLSYRSILKNLGDDCVPLTELNARIKILLENHNNALLSGRDYSRRSQFEELERSTLQPLPELAYNLKKHAGITVMKNGYVMLHADKHYYSVPYRFIGKKVKILYSKYVVEVFYKYEKIAEHTRTKSRHNYTTNETHLASQQKAILEWNPEKFLADARAIDEVVEYYIGQVLLKKSYPEQAYRSCMGILSYGKRKGHPVLIAACTRAHYLGRYSYTAIEEIIQGGIANLEIEQEPLPGMPMHENVRGKNYYK